MSERSKNSCNPTQRIVRFQNRSCKLEPTNQSLPVRSKSESADQNLQLNKHFGIASERCLWLGAEGVCSGPALVLVLTTLLTSQ